MGKEKTASKILTFMFVTLTWTIISLQAIPTTILHQSNNASSNTTTLTTPSYETLLNSNVSRLSNSDALQYLVSILTGRYIPQNVTQETPRISNNVPPSLLDYENETCVEELEKIVVNETIATPEIILPPDVYEVSLEVWINEEDDGSTSNAEESSEETMDETQRIITESLRFEINQETPTAGPHTIRHRGRRLAARSTQRRSGPVVSLPIESLDINNIQNLFRQQQRNRDESRRSMNLLDERDTFNLTVDYQAPFQNIDKDKILEILDIMNTDCSERRKMVRWVSGMRGILFECQNGAWVVTYLSRRQGKPRPTSVTDCHEIHSQGLNLSDRTLKHRLVITYSNEERKSKEVFCKHDSRHTNHQLIDNHINADPNQPVLPVRQTMSGAWTVIQRREHGGTKFYRSMRRYKSGFGNIDSGEYWLGLEALHETTHIRNYMLRVEVTTGDNITYFSEYSRFRVGSEAKSYRLRLGSFIDPINSTLSSGDFLTLHHGGKFHTRDSDRFAVNCARLYGTAFWFRGCWAAVNLNGPYVKSDPHNSGVRWATANPNEVRRVWKTEMMMKPIL